LAAAAAEREDAGNGTRALDGRSAARFCAVSTLVLVVESIATIRIDSRRRIEAAVFDSVQPVLLCDGTSRYGVPEYLTTG